MRPRILVLGLFMLCGLGSVAKAQWFPNAPWNKCANGQCLQSQGQQVQQVQQFSNVVVGQVFPDGSVVTAVDPVPTTAPLLPQSSVMAGRRDFRQVLLEAATQSLRDKEINRFQHGRLLVSALRPRELANIQAWVHQNAILEGLATAASPDWDAIIAFIKELIPLIIQLIDLFSQVQPHLEAQYVLRTPTIEAITVCDWSGLAV